uniref:Uncharacterized protein n=1 Tax=Erythrolobus madagascarensis TaxID=708628 RepID=A0A7S0T470_9RHOD
MASQVRRVGKRFPALRATGTLTLPRRPMPVSPVAIQVVALIRDVRALCTRVPVRALAGLTNARSQLTNLVLGAICTWLLCVIIALEIRFAACGTVQIFISVHRML